MGEERKRLVAVKLWITDVLKSTYIKGEGLRPNYLLTQDNRKISRVNLIGTIVSVGDAKPYSSIVIDDGSGKIAVRSFEQNTGLDTLSLGDSILVIGRPREYGGEVYILLEIVKRIGDYAWLEVRKRELQLIKPEGEAVVEEENLEYVEDSGIRQRVFGLIKSIDDGEGALYDEILRQMPESSELIKDMIKMGEIFEVKKGRLKAV